jgi:hypothetical protein
MVEERMRERRHWRPFGWVVPAGLLIGMGIGWLVDRFVPGLFIGLGVGIAVAGALRARTKVD